MRSGNRTRDNAHAIPLARDARPRAHTRHAYTPNPHPKPLPLPPHLPIARERVSYPRAVASRRCERARRRALYARYRAGPPACRTRPGARSGARVDPRVCNYPGARARNVRARGPAHNARRSASERVMRAYVRVRRRRAVPLRVRVRTLAPIALSGSRAR